MQVDLVYLYIKQKKPVDKQTERTRRFQKERNMDGLERKNCSLRLTPLDVNTRQFLRLTQS